MYLIYLCKTKIKLNEGYDNINPRVPNNLTLEYV